jgi:catechol 2,3-dioxygenase-like lactoylglutathione lyase family enzyme
MTDSLTQGVHHVGLAVPDLEAAHAFFRDALGYRTVGGDPDYPSHFLSDGHTLLTLWQLADPATAIPFDRRRNAGLHHLAIQVATDEALDIAYSKVRSWPGASIENEPGALSEGSAVRHFMCAIPGGIRLEFATPFA